MADSNPSLDSSGRRVTMKDVARETGVSVMTVSLALRGHQRISQKTRILVTEVAGRMGYRPDPALSALAAYRKHLATPAFAGTLGFLNPYPEEDRYLTQRLHREYYEAAKARALALGYGLEVCWLGDPSMSERRMQKILYSRNIMGLLLAPMPDNRRTLGEGWERFTVVALGYTLDSPAFDRVGTSQFHSSLECMKQLRALGYRRIGYVNTHLQEERTRGRFLGAVTAYQITHIPEEDWVKPIIRSKIEGVSYREWLKSEKPDAILAAQGGYLRILDELGYKIPEDIGVVFPYYHEHHPEFSSFHEDTRRIAEVAVDRLVQKLNNGSNESYSSGLNLMVDGLWHDGISTRVVGPSLL